MIWSDDEGARAGEMAGDEEAELGMVVVFGVGEDGEEVVTVELDEPFGGHGGMDAFRDLNGVCLEFAVGIAGRRVVFPVAVADFIEQDGDRGRRS